jgi:hypothetical protein
MQIQEPFLEQELWSPDGKLLTVLMHPGRVKSGLIAHDERGPILSPGEDVTLTLDGHPIKQVARGAGEYGRPCSFGLEDLGCACRFEATHCGDA